MCAMPLSLCVLCTGSLTSQDNPPGWGMLTPVQCPQLISCLCNCLDLPGVLQVEG